MASLTRWTWVWAISESWWWTVKPGVLQSMGFKESDTTEWLNWTDTWKFDWLYVLKMRISWLCLGLSPSLQIRKLRLRISLVVQWLALCPSIAVAQVLFLVRGAKILQGVRRGQKNRKRALHASDSVLRLRKYQLIWSQNNTVRCMLLSGLCYNEEPRARRGQVTCPGSYSQ